MYADGCECLYSKSIVMFEQVIHEIPDGFDRVVSSNSIKDLKKHICQRHLPIMLLILLRSKTMRTNLSSNRDEMKLIALHFSFRSLVSRERN